MVVSEEGLHLQLKCSSQVLWILMYMYIYVHVYAYICVNIYIYTCSSNVPLMYYGYKCI